MRRSRIAIAAATLTLSLASSRLASAQELVPSSIGTQPQTTQTVEQKHPYWQSWPTRAFVAAVFDVGVLYLRPTLQIGYGRPHWRWVGVEGYSSLSLSSEAEYGGVRISTPYVDLRAGARYSASLLYHFLPQQDTYSRDDVESGALPKTRYVAQENEISISLPTGFGSVFAIATGYALFGVPDGELVLEDTLHTVVRAPFIWRARGGFFAKVTHDGGFKLGLAAEFINVPRRDDLYVVRAGPLASLQLTYHLDAQVSFVPRLFGRDTLGLLGADFGQFGLRYRWATGDLFRSLP